MATEIIEVGVFATTFIAAIGAAASAIANLFSANAARTAAEAARDTVAATRQAAEETRRAAEATKVGTLAMNMSAVIDEYRSEQMRDSLKNIGEAERSYPDLQLHWSTRRLGADIHDRLDRSRRHIYWYYRKCWELQKAGLLPERFFQDFVSTRHGYPLFYRVVAPMSAALRPEPLSDEDWVSEMTVRWPPQK